MQKSVLEKIKDALEIKDNIEKGERLYELDWILERRDFSEDEALTATSLLLEHLLKEKDNRVQDSMTNALRRLSAFDIVSDTMDWEALVAQLPSFSRETDALNDVLDILGFSKNKKYLPVLETYLDDPSSGIQSAAVEAIVGIKLANHMVSEQESESPIDMMHDLFDQINQRRESRLGNIGEIKE